MSRWALLVVGLLLLASCAEDGGDIPPITTSAPAGSTTTSIAADWLTPAEDYLDAYRDALNAHDPVAASAFHVPESLVVKPPPGVWG